VLFGEEHSKQFVLIGGGRALPDVSDVNEITASHQSE
jgi:hypothetical protein